MNASERFFRRYIFSTVRIIVLFLAVNIILVASYFVIAYFGNVATSKFPIEDFSNHVTVSNGEFSADIQAKEMLNNAGAWAMMLGDDGTVVWEENLPGELPRHYSSMDIAMFSRWYLDDYPTNIAKRQDGLLVIGFPPGSVVNYYFSFKAQYIWPMLFGLAAVFCINILLMIYLFIRNARRVEKAMVPILRGIRHLSSGKPIHLEETGELAEINADDFLIGVIGSKEDAEQIKQDVGCFIREKLHLEMSEEKTLITHGHDSAKFLGYEVTIAKGEHNKKTKTGATRRVNNGKVLLYVPHDKWVKRLFSYNALKIKYDKQNGNKEVWEPVRRTRLLHLDDLEILNQYNAEIRGLYNYYRLANNVSVLNNFYYVMRYSMLKTFAGKYRTRISRIIRKYRQGKDFVVEYPKKNGKVGKVLFYNNGFRRNIKVEGGNPDIVARVVENYGRNSLIKRLKANKCEWCGAENVPLEIHHVRKLKDLSGKKQWEIAMIGRKRKTMALCVYCHDKLHAGKLD